MAAVAMNAHLVSGHPSMWCSCSWSAGHSPPGPSLYTLRSTPSSSDNSSSLGSSRNGRLLEIQAARNDVGVALRSPRNSNLDGLSSSWKGDVDFFRCSVKNSNCCGPECSNIFACQGKTHKTAASNRRSAASEGEIVQGDALHGENDLSHSVQAPFKWDSALRSWKAKLGLEANLADTSSRTKGGPGGSERQATSNGYRGPVTSTLVLDRKPITGGAFDFHTVTEPLISKPLVTTKKIVLVRHGLSSWNAESRIQGSSDMSVLSDEGIAQAERCKRSLAKLKFSSCYASPISRAKTSAEVIWSGREEPLVYLDLLKEAHLLFLEGMRNVDAREQYPELFRSWREDPSNFQVDGVYPIVELWDQAKAAWQEILSSEGELILVVTHKSILRALLCTALGLGPDRFRCMDINNGGISIVTVNTKGQPLLQCLNMTAHMHVDGVFY